MGQVVSRLNVPGQAVRTPGFGGLHSGVSGACGCPHHAGRHGAAPVAAFGGGAAVFASHPRAPLRHLLFDGEKASVCWRRLACQRGGLPGGQVDCPGGRRHARPAAGIAVPPRYVCGGRRSSVCGLDGYGNRCFDWPAGALWALGLRGRVNERFRQEATA